MPHERESPWLLADRSVFLIRFTVAGGMRVSWVEVDVILPRRRCKGPSLPGGDHQSLLCGLSPGRGRRRRSWLAKV